MKKIVTKKAPEAIGPYSQAYIANGFLFTSGQIPIVPETGMVIAGGIKEQTEQVIKNLKAVLEEAKTNCDYVIKTTCFLQDMKKFEDFNEVYKKHFLNAPARSCVAVKELPKNVLCEVEVIAILPKYSE